jgi:cyanocobalamin reductase (cyanide-eliminating) / alkylcobalamin dealkylase
VAVTSEEIIRAVRERCAQDGLDLVQPFAVGLYNDAVQCLYRLPDYGRASTLGVLVGNTRALWPCFVRALRAQPQWLAEPHPLDAFVEERVRHALLPIRTRWEVRWAHEAPPRRVAMQRLAHVAGLAYLSPAHLSVHATYGPWIALRAAAVVDVDGPTEIPPELPNPCPTTAGPTRDSDPAPAVGCEQSCMTRFRDAVAAAGILGSHTAVKQHWQLWVAVRDACAAGRAHRYSEEQIHYHYTKDIRVLRGLVERAAL